MPEAFVPSSSVKKVCLETALESLSGLKACNFIQKRLQHRCFPVNFAKF